MRPAVVLAALAALLVAGCGGSSRPKGPPALVFVSTKDGDYALFGAEADGSNVRRLTKEKGDPSSSAGLFFQIEPQWAPDGKEIAFVSGRDGRGHVYVMNADGTGARTVTNLRWVSGYPAWSPDSKRLAFMSNAGGTHDHNEIFTTPLTGGKPTQRTFSTTDAIQPAWSPDGGISFSRDGAIWLGKDGKETKLTSGDENDSAPAWNPKPPASK
jgi:TolB protein